MKDFFLSLYKSFLRRCARCVVRRTRPYVIGVTGSVGKTTARLIIAQTIQQQLPQMRILTSPKNFNGEMGFALSVLGIESFSPSVMGYLRGAVQALWSVCFSSQYDVMVLEYGIDHKGEMDQMLAVAVPDVGVITCIDVVHSEQMGDPTHIAEEKRKMIEASRDVVFLNRDDEYVRQMSDGTDADVLWYSIMHGKEGDVGYRSYELIENENGFLSSKVELFGSGEDRKGCVSVYSKELISYVAIGRGIASVLAYRRDDKWTDVDSLDFVLQPGRATLFRGISDSIVLDSSYNASPVSMKAMLGLAYRIKHDVYNDNRPLVGIIGDMRELGDLSEQAHRHLAGILSQSLDMIVLVGQEVLNTIDELQKIGYPKKQIRHFISSREAGEWVRDLVCDNERHQSIVFVKGSQNTIYTEEAVKELLADSADVAKLGRQERRWMKKKETWFASCT